MVKARASEPILHSVFDVGGALLTKQQNTLIFSMQDDLDIPADPKHKRTWVGPARRTKEESIANKLRLAPRLMVGGSVCMTAGTVVLIAGIASNDLSLPNGESDSFAGLIAGLSAILIIGGAAMLMSGIHLKSKYGRRD